MALAVAAASWSMVAELSGVIFNSIIMSTVVSPLVSDGVDACSSTVVLGLVTGCFDVRYHATSAITIMAPTEYNILFEEF